MELLKYVSGRDFGDFGFLKDKLEIPPPDPSKSSFNLDYSLYPIDPISWSELGGVKVIGGDLVIDRAPVTSLEGLEHVGGEFSLYNNKSLTTLGNTLKRVDRDIMLRHSKVEDLGSLEYVGDSLYVDYKEITSLGNLTEVGGYVDLSGAEKLETLGNLTKVGFNSNVVSDSLWLLNTPNLKSLGKLEAVAGGKIHVTRGSTTAQLVEDSKFASMIVYYAPYN